MNKSTSAWLHGLLAAFIGGASGMMEVSLGVLIIAPEKFNVGPVLWKTLLTIFVLGGITGAKVMFAYLKQAPLPPDSVEVTSTNSVTVTPNDVTATKSVKTTVTATPTDDTKG